ncbi:MAG: hypothetical protein K2K10_00215, partial [Acetatifactor sp.]|nr:hypothetical protein [Acetatifactor sp.]
MKKTDLWKTSWNRILVLFCVLVCVLTGCGQKNIVTDASGETGLEKSQDETVPSEAGLEASQDSTVPGEEIVQESGTDEETV